MTAPGRRARKSSGTDAEAFAAELELEEDANKLAPSVIDEQRASAGQLREVLEAETATVVGDKVSADHLRELLAQARAEARQEAMDEMATTPHIDDELAAAVRAEDPSAVVIHFLEDGLTAPDSPTNERVWYRGEEMVVQKGSPMWDQVKGWITLNSVQQYDRWGVQYFDKGPWPYGLYDTSDPELSEEERRVLEKANRRRMQLRGDGMPAGSAISKSRPRSDRAPSFLKGSRE